jgi:hypothetical protein
MKEFIDRTIVVSGPKRSGGTLLTRLFDSHPGIIDFIDEAFFWEHVYTYLVTGKESLFIDVFKNSGPKSLAESFIDRDLLPWINGTYRQIVPREFEMDLEFKKDVFLNILRELNICSSISEIWNCLVKAYAYASAVDYSGCRTAFMFGGDWGRSMLATKKTLKNCRCIFFMRNPYFALESLKKSRMTRGAKALHPINFAQVINHYFFVWNNRSEILDERTLLIRYEDLVGQPEETMRKVADHVGVEFTDNLLIPTLRGRNWGGDSSFEELKGIDKSVLRRNIKVLNQTEIDVISMHLKPILEYFDYRL